MVVGYTGDTWVLHRDLVDLLRDSGLRAGCEVGGRTSEMNFGGLEEDCIPEVLCVLRKAEMNLESRMEDCIGIQAFRVEKNSTWVVKIRMNTI
ncbi:hypothetical protein WN48_00360 [Eufriesea mexicana]|uniref:Uncharacterized protein n=1 Tax=Eufriesea mexicana TaxID=516756 RepID=A0A310S5E6_9HYME|nr:hypothetical protein WN48_00360 [Eufriesea mexicana]